MSDELNPDNELKLTDKGPWGVYDLMDDSWVGTPTGPNVYNIRKDADDEMTENNMLAGYRRFVVYDIPRNGFSYKGETTLKAGEEPILRDAPLTFEPLQVWGPDVDVED